MPNNQALWDRAVRVTIGLGLFALVLTGPETLLGFFGFVPLVTGLLGFCPIYHAMGVGTCRVPARPSKTEERAPLP